jgi:hypothetical protein
LALSLALIFHKENDEVIEEKVKRQKVVFMILFLAGWERGEGGKG